MAGEPAKQRVAKIQREDAFGVLNGSPFAGGHRLPMRPMDDAAFTAQWIADQTATLDDGEQPEIEGSRAGISAPLPCYAAGLGVVGSGLGAQDGETPVMDALDYLIASMMGGDPVIVAGDTVAAADPTPTAHTFGFTTQTTLDSNGVVVVGIAIGGVNYWRPVVVTDGVAVCEYDFPSAVSAGATILGTINHQWRQPPIADWEDFSIQALLQNALATRQFLALGGILNTLALAAVLRDLWTLEPNVMWANWIDDQTGQHDSAMTSLDPAVKGPHMGADGFIATAGSSTYAAENLRCFRAPGQFQWSRNLTVRPCQSNGQGVDFYNAPGNASPFQGTITVDRDATWRDYKRAGTALQMLHMQSRLAGRAFGFYEPALLVQPGEPTRNVTDEVLTQSVPLRRATGYTDRYPVIFRG